MIRLLDKAGMADGTASYKKLLRKMSIYFVIFFGLRAIYQVLVFGLPIVSVDKLDSFAGQVIQMTGNLFFDIPPIYFVLSVN
jgi:hypothetical protein